MRFCLQDFYSHSNWVELGSTAPFSPLIRPELPLNNLAGTVLYSCSWVSSYSTQNEFPNQLCLMSFTFVHPCQVTSFLYCVYIPPTHLCRSQYKNMQKLCWKRLQWQHSPRGSAAEDLNFRIFQHFTRNQTCR